MVNSIMNFPKKSEHVTTNNSVFHVNLPRQLYEERGVDIPEEEQVIQPALFPGEVVLATANNVLKFTPGCEHNTGISGTLHVTELRIILHTTLPPTEQEQYLHHLSLNHLFLSPHDIELCLIASVHLLDEHNTRRKQSMLVKPLPDRLPGIQLVLKNFRVVNLSFKFSPLGEEIKVVNELLDHSSPALVDQLFLSPGRPPLPAYIPTFRTYHDWQCELERTGCPNWRVTHHNDQYNLSSSYPRCLVIPASLLDKNVEVAAQHFRESRPLAWVWGAPGGAALAVMAHISPNIGDTVSLNPRSLARIKMSKLEENAKSMENTLVKAAHHSHPFRQGPLILDLDTHLPAPADLHDAATRLLRLHRPDSVRSSSSYLSRLEGTRWLGYVSRTLEEAQQAAKLLADRNSTVILQEGSGRDTACVVGTLVEVLCCPYARTIRGLHACIAKHWVAMGHPFTTRLGHTKCKSSQGACLLLLLDCLHQVCVQHPHLVEYSPAYLAALWAAAHCPLYTTCLFDSESNRNATVTRLQRESRPSVEFWDIWNWWASCTPQTPDKVIVSPDPKIRNSSTNCNTAAAGGKPGRKLSERSNRSATMGVEDPAVQAVTLTTFPSDINSFLRRSEDNDGVSTDSSVTTATTITTRTRSSDSNTTKLTGTTCTKSCRLARRNFLSPMYVHQLFSSFLTPGALDRIHDPMSIAHHTWHQIRRLLFPAETQHLPYDTSMPPVYPHLGLVTSHPPTKSQLPPRLKMDCTALRLEPWVGLFGQWLPQQEDSLAAGIRAGGVAGSSASGRKVIVPENPHLLFWDVIYEMYNTVSNYIQQPPGSSGSSGVSLAALKESLIVNGLKI